MKTHKKLVLLLPDGQKKTVECLYSDIRIKTIPEGYNRYSIRHADDDWVDPATLEPRVIVNHMADILTKEKIDFGKDGYLEIESIIENYA